MCVDGGGEEVGEWGWGDGEGLGEGDGTEGIGVVGDCGEAAAGGEQGSFYGDGEGCGGHVGAS